MKRTFMDRKWVGAGITILAFVEYLLILSGMIYGSISMSAGADTNSAFGIWLAPIGILVLFPGLAGAYVVYRVIRRHGEVVSAARTWAALSAFIAPLMSCLWMLLLDSVGSSLFRGMEGSFLPSVIGAVVIGLALAPGIVLHLRRSLLRSR